jgi:hypothetical protein
MNTNDNREIKSDKSAFRFARRAAVIALPLGLLAATAAAPVQAVGDVDPAQPPIPVNTPIAPINLPVTTEGAELTFEKWEAKEKTLSTGPLEGQVALAETPDGVAAADLVMYNPVGEEGDLGQVRVTSVDPVKTEANAAKQYVVAFEIEAVPGHQAPVTLQTAPFEIEAVAEATDIKQFPPVNQLYSLQEPVDLYTQENGQAGSEVIGQLESFPVLVNQS